MNNVFKVSPRIISHLGADLIKNESIALLELAKNSYDACATKCEVYFDSSEGSVQEIIIKDDGVGMTLETVTNVYLTIGTDYKKKGNTTICGRAPLGEKGIGRLGIHKLGNSITIITRSVLSAEIEITIDWDKLDDAGSIGDFPIPVEVREQPLEFAESTGTKIIVKKLKSEWAPRQIRDVYRDLNSLNSPFLHKSDSFEVRIHSNESLFNNLPDFTEIKASALYTGYCKMQGNRIVDFKYEFIPWKQLTKISAGRTKGFEDLQEYEKSLVDIENRPLDLHTSEIGPIEFNVLIFELSTDIFAFVGRERKSIREYLKENGGIRVYRDGMRVYNYGEKDNDWLGLDRRRIGRFAGNVGNGMILGAASLNRSESGGLMEKSNREGFIENQNYYIFTQAVEYALSLIVRERNIDKETLNTLYKKNKVIEPVISDLFELIEFVEANIEEPDKRRDILKYLYRINTQYADVKEILLKSANAGLNFSLVVHEVQKQMAILSGCIKRNELNQAILISTHLEDIIDGYSSMLLNSAIERTLLSKIVNRVKSNFRSRFGDHEINVFFNEKERGLEAYLSESKAISVLTNVVDNSIYWLKYAVPSDRKISFSISDAIRFGDTIYHSIIVSDNGPGFNIPPDMALRPFVTGKPHNNGSGLGLHIANELMKEMDGRILFLTSEEDYLPEYINENGINSTIIALCFPVVNP